MGEYASFSGNVRLTAYRQDQRGEPTFLNIGNGYPVRNRLDIVIWRDDLYKWEEPPVNLYFGKDVIVRGQVELYDGIPRIEIDSPSQITIIDD